MDISTIEPSMEGEFVEVSGEIISREDHEDGHVFLVIDDGSGSINVPIFVEENIDTTGLVVGEEIVVQGAVKMYEGELEVNPGSPDDVRIVE